MKRGRIYKYTITVSKSDRKKSNNNRQNWVISHFWNMTQKARKAKLD